jgi:hypothetical protein
VCSKIGNDYGEGGSRLRYPERETVVGSENLSNVLYNCFYRVRGQGFPKIIHNSGAQPSCVQEASDKCQTGQLHNTTVEEPHSRRVRNSLWGDIIERNLTSTSESESTAKKLIVIPALPYIGW